MGHGMSDSLQRLVRTRDVRHNTERQLRQTQRAEVWRVICLKCRAVWTAELYPVGRHPGCGGQLVEVSG